MKILQINNVHYRRGGADAVYLNTAELLQQYGHQVVFFNMLKKGNLPCKDEKYWVSSLESRPRGIKSTLQELRNFYNNPEAAIKIEELILAEKPDIAHIHLFYGMGISPSIARVLHKYHIPLVHSVHDYRMVCPISLFMDRKGRVCEDCKGKLFYKAIIKGCSHNGRIATIIKATEMYYHNRYFHPLDIIDGFIFVSSFSYEKHVQFMPKMREANTTVLYNFAQSEGSYERNSGEDYYLYYGRLSYEKGIATLLDAFRQLPQLSIKVVGTGPLEKELRATYSYCNNIQFLGYKTGDELKSIVRNARFVCVPSECYENNPMTIVESYAVGTPVLGAEIGGIPEIIDNNKTGYSFKSGDGKGLLDTLEKTSNLNKEEYEKIRRMAYVFYEEHFSPSKHYEKLMGFYKQTLEQYERKFSDSK